MATVASVVALLTAIFKAFPIVDEWAKAAVYLYLKTRYQSMVDADVRAIHALIINKDQREIEKLLGYSKAGEPSGIPGAVIVPSLPGLPLSADQTPS